MKTLLNKLIQVSKVTMVLFYISMVIVLVLAAGTTTALAAAPGDPFLLGESNTIGGSTTRLQGGKAGAMLEIFNRSPDPNASALHLSVSPGQPPLEVSATAGKATNLDADKLDGRDSKSFADGTDDLTGKAKSALNADNAENAKNALNAKNAEKAVNATNAVNAEKAVNAENAKNAEKLDGKDPLQFWSGSTYQRFSNSETSSCSSNGNGVCGATASCDPGDVVLSVGGGDLHFQKPITFISLSRDSARVVINRGITDPIIDYRAAVLCADFP